MSTIEIVKDFYAKVKDLPMPEGFTVAKHWQARQAAFQQVLPSFLTPQDAIIGYAQKGELSGYDHREKEKERAEILVDNKLNFLKTHFAGHPFWQNSSLAESLLCPKESVVYRDGKGYSNIFLAHLYFYLSASEGLTEEQTHIFEFGTGYGSLARIFKLGRSKTHYTLVDLPESLFFAATYLMENFPDTSVNYVMDPQDPYLDADFTFVPVQCIDYLENQSFDLAINTWSLQEMTATAVDFWMNLIQYRMNVDNFYSCNYFFNNKSALNETSADDVSLMSPILDINWSLRKFKINPSIVAEETPRNWLELFVSRERDISNSREQIAKEAVVVSNQFEVGSDDQIAVLWDSIRLWPTKKAVDAILDAIDIFSVTRSKYRMMSLPSADIDKLEEYSEKEYFRTLGAI